MDDKSLDVACAQVGALGGAFTCQADTIEIADEHGLELYFLGRGSMLYAAATSTVVDGLAAVEAAL